MQANNRLFAVIFWFMSARAPGPLGVGLPRDGPDSPARGVHAPRVRKSDVSAARIRDAAVTLHGWLAWIPARLTAVGYATAGNFDDAIAALRAPTEQATRQLSEHNEHLLARVGVAALALQRRSRWSPMTEAVLAGPPLPTVLSFGCF